MKPEPLKGKEQAIIGHPKLALKGIKTPCFTKHDVKSAVEWLKLELAKEIEFAKSNPHKTCRSFNQIIDKAFEDVMCNKTNMAVGVKP